MKSSLLSLLLFAVAIPATANVSLTTTALPNGVLDKSYTAALQASGGCTPYKWKLVSGSLPAGITKTVSSTTTTLRLSGVPTAAASYSFTIAVTGCAGKVSSRSYKIVIQQSVAHVVDLKWNASTSAHISGYNVYRSSDALNWHKINTGGQVASTLYDDTTVANGSTYFYATTAVNISGVESSRTPAVKVVIP